MQYARFINRVSAARKTSPIRKITEITAAGGPSLITFGTGAPNSNCFPFEAITVKTKDGFEFELKGPSLSQALSYAPSSGFPDLWSWLKELQTKVHNPPILNRSGPEAMDLLITPGSQDGLSMIFEMCLSPGDAVLIEEPTYPGTLAALRAFKPKFLSVQTDAYGLRPDSLRSVLNDNKDSENAPKLLYLQPNCSNPTGICIPLERRRQILEIAREFDLLLVEDDPYYYLNFEPALPSFLSLDEDGRVLRLDSFSKIMSSGLGFVTGPHQLIDRLMLHLQVTSLQCSSTAQALVLHLVKHWNVSGFLEHSRNVADFYRSQCNKMLGAANEHLSGLAEWNEPTGGMFLWIRATNVKDTSEMISERALAKKVVLAPGNLFFVDDHKPSSYMRAAFSIASEDQMHEGFKRLADLLRSEENKE